MPKQYDYPNLNRRTVFLSDGTQHSYLALPEDYPLEAVTEPVFDVPDDDTDGCANELVDVFAENYSFERATSSTPPAVSRSVVSNNSQSSTPPVNVQNSEKQTHHSQDNQSILDMLAQAKAQLETIGEKLRHAIVQNSRGTIFDCIEKNAASKPLLAREAIKEFQEMPMSDDYDEGTKSLPNEVIFLSENTIEQQKNEDQQPIYDDDKTMGDSNVSIDVCATIPEQQPYEDTQQGSGQSPKCFSMPIFSPETPTVGIDIDQLLNCPCEASECITWDEEYQGDDNSLWEKSVCRTATWHHISLFPWDPGTSASLHSSKGNFCWHQDVKFNGIALWLITFNPP